MKRRKASTKKATAKKILTKPRPKPNLFTKSIRLSRHVGEVKVAEYAFRSRLQPNGYWVTLAVLVIPNHDVFTIGASACSPEDAEEFDRTDAGNRAVGRCRQIATAFLTNTLDTTVHTLIGPGSDCVRKIGDGKITVETMMKIVEPLYAKVATNAEYASATKAVRRLQHKYPDFTIILDSLILNKVVAGA